MKGRIVLDGIVHAAVHIACDDDLLTIYRTAGEGLDMLLTLVRARLTPTDNNTLLIEGFARKAGTGDPETAEPAHGDAYIFQRIVFTPEPIAAFSINTANVDGDPHWSQGLN